MKFSGKVGNGPVNKRLTFGGDLDHRLDTGIVSAFDTVERYRKGYQPTAACSSRHCHRIRNYDVITSLAHDRQRD